MNAVTKLNKIIKRDVNLPFFVNVFSEEFAEIHCIFLVDMFSEYDQILLDFQAVRRVGFLKGRVRSGQVSGQDLAFNPT